LPPIEPKNFRNTMTSKVSSNHLESEEPIITEEPIFRQQDNRFKGSFKSENDKRIDEEEE